MDNTNYTSPLSSRYASKEMEYLFSAQHKHSTWRKLWLTLAKCEKELGIAITDAQIAEYIGMPRWLVGPMKGVHAAIQIVRKKR